jgi:predicted N-formylglutamate amidohydrolase
MPAFHNDDERAAWAMAETLLHKARAMMRQAESALESWKVGRELNRRHCARRGISATDAEIRWSETADAKNALSDNSFHVGLATMYYGAAAAHYSRALYLRERGAARI